MFERYTGYQPLTQVLRGYSRRDDWMVLYQIDTYQMESIRDGNSLKFLARVMRNKSNLERLKEPRNNLKRKSFPTADQCVFLSLF